MSLLIRKIKLFFVKPKIEECIFSYAENAIDKEYYFLMDVYFNVHDTKTKKFIGIKSVTKIIDSELEFLQNENKSLVKTLEKYNEEMIELRKENEDLKERSKWS